MKKILRFFTILFFLLIFASTTIKTAYAICSNPQISPNSPLSTDFFDEMQITTTDICFATGQDYTVMAYPSGETPRQDTGTFFAPSYTFAPLFESLTSSGTLIRPENALLIKGKLNFNQKGIDNTDYYRGIDYSNKKWTIKICTGNPGNCWNNSSPFLLLPDVVSFTAPTPTLVPPTPTPTPIPLNLVKVFFVNNICQYQSGLPLPPLTVNNANPNQHYNWWWYGDISTQGSEKAGDTAFIMNINGETTAKEFFQNRKHIICVDIQGLKRCSPGSQNSIEIKLTEKPPADSMTCTEINAPPTPFVAPTAGPSPTPIPPALLPCAEGLSNPQDPKSITSEKKDIKKCTKIDSAIGEIPTDPAEFVKKIFTVLLSMAGGWATYLITTAGYQLMFSHGEAEAIKEAREKITSAIVGIVFMLLSLVILRVIGVDIFGLPSFGN